MSHRHPPVRTIRCFGIGWRSLLISSAVCLLTATEIYAATPKKDLTWPPPPAAPRIRYLRSLTGPADLGIRRSFWGRAFGAITGQSQRDALAKPFGIALDQDDNLLVVDTSANTVFWFDVVHHAAYRWDKIGSYRLASPVAVARHRETFYVADSALPAVLAFDLKGNCRFALTNGLERPAGLAILGEKLFVADASAHRVAVFDTQGRPLTQFGRRGTGPGDFNFPTHLAGDAQGRLLVTDSMNSRVQILDQEGHVLGVVGGAGDGPGHFSRPKGVAVDKLGHIYVADALFDNIQVFDLKGQFLMHFGSSGQQPGEFWLPGGVATGRDNRVYVADSYNRRIQVFQYVGEP
jgi:DNA-binding beta-propeller fold protein YncE